MKRLKILLIEPFFGGSHRHWAEGLQANSRHEIEILSLKPHHWKWRMLGGTLTLARRFMAGNFAPDLILVSDMLDLATFQGLTRSRTAHVPFVLYMHENQITYPQQSPSERDDIFGFLNFSSALAADQVWFNSAFHQRDFLENLPIFLQKYPSPNEKGSVETIVQKSKVMSLGVDLNRFLPEEKYQMPPENRAVILWNHRWEHDKNPEQFFKVLMQLHERGIEFKLNILGEKNPSYPPIFDEAKAFFGENILQFGYAESAEDYKKCLWNSDILPVTSIHDFFGVSVVEAMACNVVPLLPKRLAYPEHIPKAYHDSFFYEGNERDFTNKLQRMILNVSILRKQNTRQFVEHYDWQHSIENYDTAFDNLTVK